MQALQAIEERRSIRSYLNKTVEPELLEQIVSAGRLAPTGGNRQPLRFTVVTNAGIIKQLSERCYTAPWFADVPAAIAVSINQTEALSKYGERGRDLYSIQDSGAAVENMLLCATALGLGSCFVGAFNEAECSRILSLPEQERPVALVPLGYSDQVPAPRRLKEKEQVVRYLG